MLNPDVVTPERTVERERIHDPRVAVDYLLDYLWTDYLHHNDGICPEYIRRSIAAQEGPVELTKDAVYEATDTLVASGLVTAHKDHSSGIVVRFTEGSADRLFESIDDQEKYQQLLAEIEHSREVEVVQGVWSVLSGLKRSQPEHEILQRFRKSHGKLTRYRLREVVDTLVELGQVEQTSPVKKSAIHRFRLKRS